MRDYRQLFINDTPLMDVRAPIEFHHGAFPTSQNIPLLDDRQRQLVGTRYKQQGQDAAIKLGWQLATPEVQKHRVDAWKQHIQQHPVGYLYCFRGGLRSRISQQLLSDAGVDYPLIEGGYKAMRRFLIDELDANCRTMPLVLIAGRTGSGKTRVIHQLPHNSIDLEGLAKHRGSAFGRLLSEQPQQIDFENALSIAVMRLRSDHSNTIFLEDEGQMIGRVSLPSSLISAMKQAPTVLVETPLATRIDMIVSDYVVDLLSLYQQHFGEDVGMERFKRQMLDSLDRIHKRLGGVRHKTVQQSFRQGLTELECSGRTEAFRPGFELLLTEYYDRMYDYQQAQRSDRALFSGDTEAVLQWVNAHQ